MTKHYLLLPILLIGLTGLNAQNSVKMNSSVSETPASLMYSSPNGKYGVGYSNGFTILHLPYENQTYYYGDMDDETGMMNVAYVFSGVNDHGEIAASISGDDLTASKPGIFKDGTFTELELPAGVDIGNAMDISENGTVVGCYLKNGEGTYSPCVWRNGKITTLKFPAKDFYNRTETGAVAYHISADGKVITGAYISSFGDEWIPAIWTNDGEECTLPGLDFMYNLDKPVTMTMPNADDYITVPWGDPDFDKQNEAFNKVWEEYMAQVFAFRTKNLLDGRITMSPNGKYMATFNHTTDYKNIPVIIDVATGELTEINEFTDAVVLSITNDMNLSLATPNFSAIRTGYLYFTKTKEKVELKKYILDNFSFDMLDGENGLNSICEFGQSGSAVCNADGSVFFGYLGGGEIPVYNYSIVLPESLDVTSIQTAQNDGKILYYTNGAINFGGEAQQVSIYNINGSMVYQASNAPSTLRLDLPAGIYAIKAIIDGQSVLAKIAIK